MAIFFAMPKLGMNMTDGHIINWLVDEGAPVIEGQPILEIETDKATNEVESPATGILARILYHAGEDVACNRVLAVILAEGEVMPEKIPSVIDEIATPGPEAKTQIEYTPQVSAASTSTNQRISISPSAKKLAQELGVDISAIIPSGNQIKREDIQRAYEKKAGSSPSVDKIRKKPFSDIRKKTAEHMSASVQYTARAFLNIEINAENLVAFRQYLEKQTKEMISYNVILTKIAGIALTEFPDINVQLVENEIWQFSMVNIGIAMQTEKGLLVPVLKNVQEKETIELQSEFNLLKDRAISGKVTHEDLSGGTFTITNLGAFEINSFFPVINYPECAILAIGAITPKPVVQNGDVKVQHMMSVTLAFDHRIVDGVPAARFLQRFKQLVEIAGS